MKAPTLQHLLAGSQEIDRMRHEIKQIMHTLKALWPHSKARMPKESHIFFDGGTHGRWNITLGSTTLAPFSVMFPDEFGIKDISYQFNQADWKVISLEDFNLSIQDTPLMYADVPSLLESIFSSASAGNNPRVAAMLGVVKPQ